ncbi:caspase family protein [Acuticoccus sp. MNP-M23]|uniref:caspase family protein n=1 Tax=Acuticoccus sp. MNP-M23 TaxID=3072793 RepID=UPI0028156FE3|nr:caspase family protein [Acuticoccus sp. MNP-M23]WMS44150.1 caspase family protein [Acuticoccus sp. MNP-M23]
MAASDARDISASEPPRVAFVIGNQDYDNLTVDALKNPINDGKLVARSLRRLNFDVVEGYDLTLDELTTLFASNRAKIDNAEAVVLYYAGHGFQLDGKNYVVPVDAQLTSIGAIPLQTVQLDALVAELANTDRPTLIFMDACRENPLPPSVDADTIDGLAQIEAGTNTFIAFSTELGKVSFGGQGNNSPFALAMATHLETPGQSVSDLMIAVRNETQDLTLNRQTPWTQESLQAQFYFTDRQVLDPAALRIAAAEILNDPRQLEAFLKAREEENLSFLPAVFRARQRGVSVLGQPAPLQFEELYEKPADGTKKAAKDGTGDDPVSNIAIASTAPSNTDPADSQRSDDVLETLMFARLDDGRPVASAPGPQPVDRRELARKLQTELQRLGCYRMRIDGDWGRGSRGALRKYLKEKNLSADSLDPSVSMLNRTSLDSGRICREPVIIKRKKSVNVAKRTPARATVRKQRTKRASRKTVPSFRKRAAKGQSRKAQVSRRAQRREALPPDLQMGVGIGF